MEGSGTAAALASKVTKLCHQISGILDNSVPDGAIQPARKASGVMSTITFQKGDTVDPAEEKMVQYRN